MTRSLLELLIAAKIIKYTAKVAMEVLFGDIFIQGIPRPLPLQKVTSEIFEKIYNFGAVYFISIPNFIDYT